MVEETAEDEFSIFKECDRESQNEVAEIIKRSYRINEEEADF